MQFSDDEHVKNINKIILEIAGFKVNLVNGRLGVKKLTTSFKVLTKLIKVIEWTHLTLAKGGFGTVYKASWSDGYIICILGIMTIKLEKEGTI